MESSIPELKASAAGIAAGVSTAFTTVYLLIPKKAKDAALEVVKDLVSKWLDKEVLKDEEAGECVTILDQYGHPAVKVKLRQVPVSKRK